jgi:radical SAM protein with 4Fe4S-binding SPASM domain
MSIIGYKIVKLPAKPDNKTENYPQQKIVYAFDTDNPWWLSSREADDLVVGDRPEFNNADIRSFFAPHDKFRPLGLGVETVNFCNFHCRICANRQLSRKRKIMETEVFEKIIRAWSASGGGQIFLNPFIGDILLDKFLPQRVDFIKEVNRISAKQMDVFILTNAFAASRWTDRQLKEILSGTSQMSFSIYGVDAEEHDAMTGIRGAYAHTMRQITRIVALGEGRPFGFLFRTLKSDASARVLSWLEQHFGPDWRAITAGEPEILTSYANWGGLIDPKPLPYEASWAPVHDFNRDDFNYCPIPLTQMKVDVNGNLYFCPCFSMGNSDSVLGNVNKGNLVDFMNNSKAKKLWAGGLPMCKICNWAGYPGRLGLHIHYLLKDKWSI